MKLPLLKDIDVKGKRVFLRADFDVPLKTINNSQLTVDDDTRLKASLPTVQYLLDQGATVIVAGHLGRPNGVIDKNFSLEPVAKWFSIKYQVLSIKYENLQDFNGWRINDNLFVLENLRFYEGEEANDPKFAQKLASLADVYINDAFSDSHRNHASITGVAKLLPHAAGLHLQKEIEVLSQVIENPKRPLVVIIGGAKIETKLPLVEKMLSRADYVLVGGKLPMEEKIKQMVNEKLIVATLTPDGTDITDESIEKFVEVISKAGTIIWNGPMGKSEVGEKGTEAVANAVIESNAYTIVGGGDTINSLQKLGIVEKFSFVSTGGGAMLAFLSGEELPGLQALLN